MLPPAPRRSAVAVFEVALGAVIISFASVLVRLAPVGPTAAGVYRMLVGGLILLPLALGRGERLWMGGRALLYVLVGSVLFAADLAFWHRSIHLVGPGLATILANFQVFLLAGFGIVVLRERFTWRFAAAIAAALGGLVLLVGADWRALSGAYRAGVTFGLLTALSYAAYLLVLRASQARPGRLEPLPNLMMICWVTAGLLGLLALWNGETLALPDARTMGILVLYGLTAQVVGWLLISRGIPHVEAGRVGLVLLLQPSLAFTWDMLFFGRPTDVTDVLGAVLALGAIYLGTVGGGRGR